MRDEELKEVLGDTRNVFLAQVTCDAYVVAESSYEAEQVVEDLLVSGELDTVVFMHRVVVEDPVLPVVREQVLHNAGVVVTLGELHDYTETVLSKPAVDVRQLLLFPELYH